MHMHGRLVALPHAVGQHFSQEDFLLLTSYFLPLTSYLPHAVGQHVSQEDFLLLTSDFLPLTSYLPHAVGQHVSQDDFFARLQREVVPIFT